MISHRTESRTQDMLASVGSREVPGSIQLWSLQWPVLSPSQKSEVQSRRSFYAHCHLCVCVLTMACLLIELSLSQASPWQTLPQCIVLGGQGRALKALSHVPSSPLTFHGRALGILDPTKLPWLVGHGSIQVWSRASVAMALLKCQRVSCKNWRSSIGHEHPGALGLLVSCGGSSSPTRALVPVVHA